MRFVFVSGMLSLVAALPLVAQPKPKPSVAIATWIDHQIPPPVQFGYNPNMARDVRIIHVRNDTSVDMAIVSARFWNCVNVSLTCASDSASAVSRPGVRFSDDTGGARQIGVAPNGELNLLRVSPARPGNNYSFKYALVWRPAVPCISVPGDSMHRTAPDPKQMIIPNVELLQSMHHGTSKVDFFVSRWGGVDSVNFTNITDAKVAERFRKTMMAYQFTAATANGCPVAGTTSVVITF